MTFKSVFLVMLLTAYVCSGGLISGILGGAHQAAGTFLGGLSHGLNVNVQGQAGFTGNKHSSQHHSDESHRPGKPGETIVIVVEEKPDRPGGSGPLNGQPNGANYQNNNYQNIPHQQNPGFDNYQGNEQQFNGNQNGNFNPNGHGNNPNNNWNNNPNQNDNWNVNPNQNNGNWNGHPNQYDTLNGNPNQNRIPNNNPNQNGNWNVNPNQNGNWNGRPNQNDNLNGNPNQSGNPNNNPNHNGNWNGNPTWNGQSNNPQGYPNQNNNNPVNQPSERPPHKQMIINSQKNPLYNENTYEPTETSFIKPTGNGHETNERINNEHQKITNNPSAGNLVPLKPNEYIYQGDKIAVNTPQKDVEDEDEDSSIDIRFDGT